MDKIYFEFIFKKIWKENEKKLFKDHF